MTYEESMKFIEDRTKNMGICPGLDAMYELVRRLGNPQEKYKVIHIAGTNGKGSTLEFTGRILLEAGYRIGFYSSPAVFDPWEIIRVNTDIIPKDRIAEGMTKIAEVTAKWPEGLRLPSAFEMQTALAFWYFEKEKCDFAVIECGLGGKEDATNVVENPFVTAITKIRLDHIAFLGDTVEKIAAQKAGILRQCAPLIFLRSQQEPGAVKVMEEAAGQCGAPIREADTQKVAGYPLAMPAPYQKENAAITCEIIEAVREKGTGVPEEAVRKVFATMIMPGRFEKIAGDPDIFVDGAHNEDGARALEAAMKARDRKYVMVMGVMKDKNHMKMLERLLPCCERLFTVKPDNPRAMEASELKIEADFVSFALSMNRVNIAEESIEQALLDAKQAAEELGADIIVCGSLYYLGDVRRIVKEMNWGK